VKKLHELCKAENSEDLIARVYPQLNKIFQRSVASISQSRTSNGLLLLSNGMVTFDALLRTSKRFSGVTLFCTLEFRYPPHANLFAMFDYREFADAVVAEVTLEFLNLNKRKLLTSFPTLLPQELVLLLIFVLHLQFFPLMLKLIAWNGENVSDTEFFILISFVFPGRAGGKLLVVALEKVERSSGSLIGSSIASLQKSAAPEMLLALMDEAYTGSTIGDEGPDFESEDSNTMAVADPLFLELLKDENDGLAERHSTSPAMAAALQVAASTPHSDRLKQTLRMTPRLLDVYFSIAVQKRLLEFMLAAFQRSPDFVALLKKPIIDRLGEAYDGPAKVARSRISDARVWRRARDYLGLMNEPAICLSILGPSRPSHRYMQNPGTVNWNEGATKMVVDIPFYILGEQEVWGTKALPFTIFPSQISFQEDNRDTLSGSIASSQLPMDVLTL
ncbi:hypothetical protein C3L33_09891, partial [Rhododendron williamsianum]